MSADYPRFYVQSEHVRGEGTTWFVCDRTKGDNGPSSLPSGIVYSSKSRARCERKCDQLTDALQSPSGRGDA